MSTSILASPGTVSSPMGRCWDTAYVLADRIRASLTNPPENVIVATGNNPHDFNVTVVAVEITRIRPGPVGQQVQPGAINGPSAYTMEVTVTVTREVETIDDQGNVDYAAEQERAALVLKDADDMLDAVHDGADNWTLLGQARDIAILDLIPIDSEAGLGGWEMHLEIGRY